MTIRIWISLFSFLLDHVSAQASASTVLQRRKLPSLMTKDSSNVLRLALRHLLATASFSR
ncbi:hypothetical protein G7Z99_19180 [Pseudomonas entomophila]|uniref:hypothetical protein n=1 Tax=Pseudomonas entomophila TaxID=312306 RepID=UPI0015E327C5|nr:hypothetical protein [Pseudomonas entomophila]MBA1191141.1 hypothetical protein [Pseudomonas entomophila]